MLTAKQTFILSYDYTTDADITMYDYLRGTEEKFLSYGVVLSFLRFSLDACLLGQAKRPCHTNATFLDIRVGTYARRTFGDQSGWKHGGKQLIQGAGLRDARHLSQLGVFAAPTATQDSA